MYTEANKNVKFPHQSSAVALSFESFLFLLIQQAASMI